MITSGREKITEGLVTATRIGTGVLRDVDGSSATLSEAVLCEQAQCVSITRGA